MVISLYFVKELKIKFNNFIEINKKTPKIFTSFCKILINANSQLLNPENGQNDAYKLKLKKNDQFWVNIWFKSLFHNLIKN